MQKTNVVGLTRFEMANVKRAFASNKAIYRKMETLENKIKALAAEYENLQNLALTWEKPIFELTQQKLGVQLNSKQVLEYVNNPEKFNEDFTAVEVPEGDEAAEVGEAVEAEEENPFN